MKPSQGRWIFVRRLISWIAKSARTTKRNNRKLETFNFLGFTYYWRASRQGYWVVYRKTMGTRFSRAIRSIKDYCRRNRHKPLVVQCKRLRSMIRGHYGYYGISGNFASIKNLHFIANKIWRKWLARRSRKSYINWDYYNKVIAKNYPLPTPKIVHKYN